METLKEYICIKNFGPIREVELNPVRPFVVLIGESGSGKSTVMKTLALFRWIYKAVNIRSYLYHAGISKQPFDVHPSEIWKYNGMAKFVRPETQITYVRGEVEIIYAEGVFEASRIVPRSELSLEKICFISERRTAIPAMLNTKRTGRMDYFSEETFDEFLAAAAVIKDLSVDYLGIKYLSEKTALGTKYYVTNTEGNEEYKIDMNTASSGIQAVIPLSIIIEYFARHYNFSKRFNRMVFEYLAESDQLENFRTEQNIGDIPYRNIHIHIEEPELSLYPESQRDLINFIVNRCLVEKHDGYGMTVMMTTHSPYIVNHLNLLLMAGTKGKEEDGAFLREEDVDVFEIVDGYSNSLKQQGEAPINTRSMSDPIADIYERYEQLENE
jgi:predicted ATPase